MDVSQRNPPRPGNGAARATGYTADQRISRSKLLWAVGTSARFLRRANSITAAAERAQPSGAQPQGGPGRPGEGIGRGDALG
jgi:hypothetical protein